MVSQGSTRAHSKLGCAKGFGPARRPEVGSGNVFWIAPVVVRSTPPGKPAALGRG